MRFPVLARITSAAHTLCIAAAFMVTTAVAAHAQNAGQVAGRVTAEGGAAVPGAQVVVGARWGTLTGADGRYAINNVPAGNHEVRVQHLGYGVQRRTVTVVAGQAVTADFQLQTQAVSLEEVVAVGYTQESRRNVSGAVASIDGEQIARQQVPTVEQALRGRLPGVRVVSSGEPGRASQIVVRGQNFMGNAAPLYVVDGMYMQQNPNLNPDDVESIQVLKDASAASQYGAQAANGVVVITTKRGRIGPNELSIRSYYGFQEVPNRVEMMDAAGWARITTMARTNAGLPTFEAARNPSNNTDWQDAVLQRGALQDHNVAISGGNENARYMVSGGFTDQQGTIIETDFQRYSLRLNTEFRRGILRVGENLSISRINRANLVGFPLIDAMRMQPTIPVRDENNASGYGYGSDANPTFGSNPVGAIERTDNDDHINQVSGTVFAEVGLPANLRYRLNVGANIGDINWRLFNRARQIRQNDVPAPTALTDRRDNFSSVLIENLLTYDNNWGRHEFDAVAGVTEQRGEFRRLQAFRRNFPDEDLAQIDAGTANFSNRGFLIENALRSYLVRTTYAYDGRYLFTGSFRRDGSSRFGPNNRWGNFAAASLGWVVSEEDFFEGVPLLGRASDYFKIRGSYGTLGNQDIGDYQYSAAIVTNQSVPFGDQVAIGATQLSLANPNIKWQENTQANIGFDINLLANRLAVTADYYVSESNDILVRAPLPPSLGSAQSPFVNAGSIRNTGFELGTTYRINRERLNLNVGANITTINNEVTELGNGGQPIFAGPFGVARTEVGAPIGHFYVRKMLGIFQTAAEVAAHGAQPNAQPGDVIYADLNGDKIINDLDRYNAGSGIPEWEGGLNLDGQFGNFDFGFGVRGSFGAEIFNVARFWSDRMDEGSNYRAGLEPWTPENRSNTTPRAIWGPAGSENAWAASDRWIESGSFVRIQNLTVGLALPNLMRRFNAGDWNSRIYLSVQNLHTFTSYSNWDPEVLGFDDPLARGIDDGRIYPNARTFTLGLDLRM